MMKKSSLVTRVVSIITKPWSIEMAHQMGVLNKGSIIGKLLMTIGMPFSRLLSRVFSKNRQQHFTQGKTSDISVK